MNESKANRANQASWEKWRASGSIGTFLDAVTEPIKIVAKPITGMGISFENGVPVQTTLSIGEKVLKSGADWEVTVPELYIVVPGAFFEIGQKIKAKDLPKGSMTLSQAFDRK